MVQIEIEYLVLAQMLFQATSQDRISNLTPIGALRLEQDVLDHLLSDGAATLSSLAGAQVGRQCSKHPPIVEPLMFIKSRVLRGQKCELDVGRHTLECD